MTDTPRSAFASWGTAEGRGKSLCGRVLSTDVPASPGGETASVKLLRLSSVLLAAALLPAVASAAAGGPGVLPTITPAAWSAAVQAAPGRVVLPMVPQEFTPGTLTLADGSTVAAGMVNTTRNERGMRLALARLLPSGRLDRSFGTDGVELTNIKLLPWRILGLGDGELLVLGPNRLPGAQEPRITSFPDWEMLRLLPDGAPDERFGEHGLLDLGVRVASETAPGEGGLPALEPDGDVVLPTYLGQLFSSSEVPALVRVTPQGQRDTTFGAGGTVTLPGFAGSAAVGADGSLTLALGGKQTSVLVRLTAAGLPDPGFNGGLALQTPVQGPASMTVEGSGAIELYGSPEANETIDSRVWRYTSSGAPDTAWGIGGVLDLGRPRGYLNELLPGGGGTTLIVTMGVALSSPSTSGGPGTQGVVIRRLTASGQPDPALGGAAGLTRALPFGGGTYVPGSLVDLASNSFAPEGVSQRPDGTLLFTGRVSAEEAYQTEGGPEPVAWINGFALASLNSSMALDRRFGAVATPTLHVRVLSTRLSARGISVQLSYPRAAMAVVKARAAGRTIAQGTVRFFSIERPAYTPTTLIPLTEAGRRLLGRCLRVAVTVSAADLVGSHPSARTSATLRG